MNDPRFHIVVLEETLYGPEDYRICREQFDMLLNKISDKLGLRHEIRNYEGIYQEAQFFSNHDQCIKIMKCLETFNERWFENIESARAQVREFMDLAQNVAAEHFMGVELEELEEKVVEMNAEILEIQMDNENLEEIISRLENTRREPVNVVLKIFQREVNL